MEFLSRYVDLPSFAILGGLATIRMMTMLSIAPVFGSLLLPKRIRAATAVVLVIALLPLMGDAPQPRMDASWLAVAALGEAAIGAAAGLSARMVVAAVEAAGYYLGIPMGLGFSSTVDPSTNTSAVVTSQFMGIIVSLLFLVMDGHHLLIRLVGASFHDLPPGQVLPSALAGPSLARSANIVFTGMVQLAAPVVVVLLGVMAAMGFLARVAQRVNLFVLSFAVSIALGIITLHAVMPDMVSWILKMLGQVETIAMRSMSTFV